MATLFDHMPMTKLVPGKGKEPTKPNSDQLWLEELDLGLGQGLGLGPASSKARSESISWDEGKEWYLPQVCHILLPPTC